MPSWTTSHGLAAINIDKNQNALIHLVKGTLNTFADADSNADKAVVYGTVTYGNGKTDVNDEIPTMKVDGKWYIDSNK